MSLICVLAAADVDVSVVASEFVDRKLSWASSLTSYGLLPSSSCSSANTHSPDDGATDTLVTMDKEADKHDKYILTTTNIIYPFLRLSSAPLTLPTLFFSSALKVVFFNRFRRHFTFRL